MRAQVAGSWGSGPQAGAQMVEAFHRSAARTRRVLQHNHVFSRERLVREQVTKVLGLETLLV
jgi:hypothetical protein